MDYMYVHANFLKFIYINHLGGRLQRSNATRLGLLVNSFLNILFHPTLIFNVLIRINKLLSNSKRTWTATSTTLIEIHWFQFYHSQARTGTIASYLP